MRFIDKSGSEPPYLLTHRLKNKTNNYDTFCYDVGLGSIGGNGLRQDVLNSQGHLCAFCMCEIPEYPVSEQDIKIAHWYPQAGALTNLKQLDITYSNIFGACCGGMIRPSKKRNKSEDTCDTKQKSKHLVLNPSNQKHIQLLHYQDDGEIYCIKIERKILETSYLNLQKEKGIEDNHTSKTGKETKEFRFDERNLTVEELKIAIQYDIEFNLNLNELTIKGARAGKWKAISNITKTKFSTKYKGVHLDRKSKNSFLNAEMRRKLGFESANKYYSFCMVDFYYLQSMIR